MGIIFAGIIACLAMDIFQRLLLFTFALPPSNWAVVGRWAFHVLRTARLHQPAIENAAEIRGEQAFWMDRPLFNRHWLRGCLCRMHENWPVDYQFF